MSPVTLTIPRDPRYGEVVELVLGGVAARFDLGVDRVDDLRLALDTAIFDGKSGSPVEITITGEDGLELLVGPLEGSVGRRLGSESGPLALRQVLGALVDEADIVERDGADWLLLRQHPTAGARA